MTKQTKGLDDSNLRGYDEDAEVLRLVEQDFKDFEKTGQLFFRYIVGCGAVPADFFQVCSIDFRDNLSDSEVNLLSSTTGVGGIFDFVESAPEAKIKTLFRELKAYSSTLAIQKICSGEMSRMDG